MATRALQIKQGDPTGGSEPGKMATQEDIDRFSNMLGSQHRDSFLSRAGEMVGGSYQSLLDLYGSYYSDPYGGNYG